MSKSPKILAEVRIPHETVNDDIVIVAEWRLENGSPVRSQDVVVDIETSKAVFEIEAEADGYLQILHPQGAEVPVGELVGQIMSEAVHSKPEAPSAATLSSRATAVSASISKKAQRLIDEHEIDPSVFDGQGLIREVDVIKYLKVKVEAKKTLEDQQPVGLPTGSCPDTTELAAKPTAPKRPRGLFGDAAASASDRGNSVVWLAWNYFWRNWLLGLGVKVAPRGVINVFHRWRGVKLGKDCFIDPTCTLETAYPENITLGDDVRITSGATIMTHIKAPHYLRETGMVPVVIAPVVLRDHCFIGVNAVIMPGVNVGKAAVVASGAVVVSNVPDYTMVAGNPAKVVKKFPKP